MSRFKKYQPYKEIINLNDEMKEYKKLCKGKSRKYTNYTDWKAAMLHLFQNLSTPDSVTNLKHYLRNSERVNNNFNSHYIDIMLVCITLLVGNIVDFPFWSLLGGIIIGLVILMLSNDNNNKEYCFYCDLIEVLEEYESQLLSCEKECASLPAPASSDTTTSFMQSQD